ncbi:monovalent cation/H+ antiporter complex subunit F [Desulfurivibrio dismutans]|uniref:monovalent cation/H+ antiporter complex subunit F n=1 Tax=Desulfurivibrio dismutans TaxID=1398908 RepID=UPI0023DCA64A|nr:monovalent cation/H+ antiporter complex subunit F [Desulfurivibrio alkaliphilus]MDF1614413.1 monovalent cation/H+ antiporter complex subunit F [Desulfurivibrio alkaliphilus]
MTAFFWALAIFLLLNAFLCLWRAWAGPSVGDRLLAMNVIGTKTLVVLVILGVVAGGGLFLDVALIYGLLNFVITVAAGRFLETGRLSQEEGRWGGAP